MSSCKTVAEAVRDAQPGTLFIPTDFVDMGSDESVRKTLSRLAESASLSALSVASTASPDIVRS